MSQINVPVIQGFILVTNLGTLLIYLVLNIIIAFMDPRISYK